MEHLKYLYLIPHMESPSVLTHVKSAAGLVEDPQLSRAILYSEAGRLPFEIALESIAQLVTGKTKATRSYHLLKRHGIDTPSLDHPQVEMVKRIDRLWWVWKRLHGEPPYNREHLVSMWDKMPPQWESKMREIEEEYFKHLRLGKQAMIHRLVYEYKDKLFPHIMFMGEDALWRVLVRLKSPIARDLLNEREYFIWTRWPADRPSLEHLRALEEAVAERYGMEAWGVCALPFNGYVYLFGRSPWMN